MTDRQHAAQLAIALRLVFEHDGKLTGGDLTVMQDALAAWDRHHSAQDVD